MQEQQEEEEEEEEEEEPQKSRAHHDQRAVKNTPGAMQLDQQIFKVKNSSRYISHSVSNSRRI